MQQVTDIEQGMSSCTLFQPLYVTMYIGGCKTCPKWRSLRGIVTGIYSIIILVLPGLNAARIMAFCVSLDIKSFTSALFVSGIANFISLAMTFSMSVLFCVGNLKGKIDQILRELEQATLMLPDGQKSKLRKRVKMFTAILWFGFITNVPSLYYFGYGSAYFSTLYFYPLSEGQSDMKGLLLTTYLIPGFVAVSALLYQCVTIYTISLLFDSHCASLKQLIEKNSLSAENLEQSRIDFNYLRDLLRKLDSITALLNGVIAIGGLVCLMLIFQVILFANPVAFTPVDYSVWISLCSFWLMMSGMYIGQVAVLGIMLHNKVIIQTFVYYCLFTESMKIKSKTKLYIKNKIDITTQ